MILSIAQLISTLGPLLIPLILEANDTWKEAKQGKIKAEFVHDSIKATLLGINWFKKGTLEYQDYVLKVADDLRDGLVGIYNIKGSFSDEVELDIQPGEQL